MLVMGRNRNSDRAVAQFFGTLNMLTYREIFLEKNSSIRDFIKNCGKWGGSRLGRRTLEEYLERYGMDESEFANFVQSEFGFEAYVNSKCYFLSKGSLRK